AEEAPPAKEEVMMSTVTVEALGWFSSEFLHRDRGHHHLFLGGRRLFGVLEGRLDGLLDLVLDGLERGLVGARLAEAIARDADRVLLLALLELLARAVLAGVAHRVTAE